jgi:FlaA1/EpsC-like NDP-sugar epimerase
VLQAAAIGDSGQVLVLDMGEAVKIVDLARDLIRLSGHSVEEIPIVFSGVRAGEKMFEELLAAADDTLPTSFSRLRVARLMAQSEGVADFLAWAASLTQPDNAAACERLAALVPEYRRPAAGQDSNNAAMRATPSAALDWVVSK